MWCRGIYKWSWTWQSWLTISNTNLIVNTAAQRVGSVLQVKFSVRRFRSVCAESTIYHQAFISLQVLCVSLHIVKHTQCGGKTNQETLMRWDGSSSSSRRGTPGWFGWNLCVSLWVINAAHHGLMYYYCIYTQTDVWSTTLWPNCSCSAGASGLTVLQRNGDKFESVHVLHHRAEHRLKALCECLWGIIKKHQQPWFCSQFVI